MAEHWNWANLNSEQLKLLRDGEKGLGADILLAFQQSQTPEVQAGSFAQKDLQLAALNEGQLQDLRKLEKSIQAVVIAFRHAR